MTKDMTSGNAVNLILSFSIPLLIGNIFQQFYSMADTIIVGRALGVSALAAVGATGSLSFLIIGFVTGLTSGFSVTASQRFGAGDENGLRKSVVISIYLCVILTVFTTVVSVVFTRPILVFMQTPADILDDAYYYIVVIFAGIFASVFYNMISSILRALGDSKTPLYFLIISSVLNIGLDIWFILGFGMGVEGAAYATVIAQAVSGILCLLYMVKKYPILHLKKEDWGWDSEMAGAQMKIGLPMALQFSITAVGCMVLQGAINSFGSETVAAYTAASKVEQIATQPMATFGVTMATWCGQNLGAQKPDRIREGVWKCTIISVAFCIAGALLVVFGGQMFVRLFVTGDQPNVMQQAQIYLNTVAIFFPVLGLLFIYRNALQGVGSSFIPMMAGVAELIMRCLVAFTLSKWMGFVGVCLAGPAAWIGATVPLCIAYFKVILMLEDRFGCDHPPRWARRVEKSDLRRERRHERNAARLFK